MSGYSLQPLGGGAFRVSGVMVSPTTGRYITGPERERILAARAAREAASATGSAEG